MWIRYSESHESPFLLYFWNVLLRWSFKQYKCPPLHNTSLCNARCARYQNILISVYFENAIPTKKGSKPFLKSSSKSGILQKPLIFQVINCRAWRSDLLLTMKHLTTLNIEEVFPSVIITIPVTHVEFLLKESHRVIWTRQLDCQHSLRERQTPWRLLLEEALSLR